MREIALSRGLVALVDDADYERVSEFKWFALPSQGLRARGIGTYYATRQFHSPRRTVSLHRFILGLGAGTPIVDHVDGDGLNNQRANLRTCTNGQNTANGRYVRNRTGFRGVFELDGRFWAQIDFHGNRRRVGPFSDAATAAHAYDVEAVTLFGDFARPNFPRQEQAA